jgi:poly(ADP-ribose) glycohydrolase ARH3
MNPIDFQSKFLGGMLGSALGDAIGELAFRYSTDDALRASIQNTETLQYTDDTAMSIGIAETLIEQGVIDPLILGETFRKNYEREPWRGYGPGPPIVFNLVQQGFSYQEAARRLFRGTGSFGNGAAMRITPIGLYFHDSPELYERAVQSAEVTHAHPLGKDGAAILASIIAMVISLSPEEEFPIDQILSKLKKVSQTIEFQEKLSLVAELLHEDANQQRAANELGTNVTIHGSVPFAIYSFLKHPRSYTDCLLHAILIRGDRDTIGAMACGISGSYLGIDKLPSEWIIKLENRDYIKELAISLFARKSAP